MWESLQCYLPNMLNNYREYSTNEPLVKSLTNFILFDTLHKSVIPYHASVLYWLYSTVLAVQYSIGCTVLYRLWHTVLAVLAVQYCTGCTVMYQLYSTVHYCTQSTVYSVEIVVELQCVYNVHTLTTVQSGIWQVYCCRNNWPEHIGYCLSPVHYFVSQ